MGGGGVDELPELEGGASQLDVVQRWLDTSDDAHFAKVVLRWLEETSAELLEPSYAVDCSWPQTTRYSTSIHGLACFSRLLISRFIFFFFLFLCLYYLFCYLTLLDSIGSDQCDD